MRRETRARRGMKATTHSRGIALYYLALLACCLLVGDFGCCCCDARLVTSSSTGKRDGDDEDATAASRAGRRRLSFGVDGGVDGTNGVLDDEDEDGFGSDVLPNPIIEPPLIGIQPIKKPDANEDEHDNAPIAFLRDFTVLGKSCYPMNKNNNVNRPETVAVVVVA